MSLRYKLLLPTAYYYKFTNMPNSILVRPNSQSTFLLSVGGLNPVYMLYKRLHCVYAALFLLRYNVDKLTR